MAAPVDLTDAGIEAFLRANKNAVLDLWAEWCVPCKRISPVLDELAADYGGAVGFAKVDTEASPQTLKRFGVMGLPAVLVFRNGQRVDHLTGFMPKPALRQRLDKAFA